MKTYEDLRDIWHFPAGLISYSAEEANCLYEYKGKKTIGKGGFDVRWGMVRQTLKNNKQYSFQFLPCRQQNQFCPAKENELSEGLVAKLTLVDTERVNTWKVLKVKFSNRDNQQYVYVKPWPLLLKNAVMYSDLTGLKLLPGCDLEEMATEYFCCRHVMEFPSVLPGAVKRSSKVRLSTARTVLAGRVAGRRPPALVVRATPTVHPILALCRIHAAQSDRASSSSSSRERSGGR